MWWIGDTYAGNFGPERSLRLVPLNTFLKNGIRWGGGSDYSVTPLAARYGLWASVERETLKGTYGAHPFGTAESVDIHTALRSYTVWGAGSCFSKTGSDPRDRQGGRHRRLGPRYVHHAGDRSCAICKCTMTLLHGEVVFDSERP